MNTSSALLRCCQTGIIAAVQPSTHKAQAHRALLIHVKCCAIGPTLSGSRKHAAASPRTSEVQQWLGLEGHIGARPTRLPEGRRYKSSYDRSDTQLTARPGPRTESCHNTRVVAAGNGRKRMEDVLEKEYVKTRYRGSRGTVYHGPYIMVHICSRGISPRGGGRNCLSQMYKQGAGWCVNALGYWKRALSRMDLDSQRQLSSNNIIIENGTHVRVVDNKFVGSISRLCPSFSKAVQKLWRWSAQAL